MSQPAITIGVLFKVMFNVAAAGQAALLLFVALEVDKRRPWALAVARPLLALVLVSSVVSLAILLSGGGMRVPFDIAVAGWALVAPPAIQQTARLRAPGVATLGLAALLGVQIAFGAQLFNWGGVLDVHEPDLHAAAMVDCGAAGTLPDRIHLRYDWAWSATSPLPSGADSVVLGWTGSDSEGRPLYVIDRIPDTAVGVFSGLTDTRSMGMVDSIGRESQGSFRWAIQLPLQRLAPGHVELELKLARPAAPNPDPLVVKATYVHLGLWRQDAPAITCSW